MTVSKQNIIPHGPQFSKIVLGFWRLADPPALNKSETEKLIQHSLDAGITTMDHADIYGDYQCEALFGRVLKEKPALRKKMELVTKCGISLISDNNPGTSVKHYDTTAKHIISSAEKSLKNLGTDYLDLLLIHRPDPLMDPDEVAEGFEKLKKDGKVHYFGVSNFSPAQFDLLQSRLPFNMVTNQIEISVLERFAFHNGSMEHCMQHHFSPMAWSPFAGGKIFQGPKNGKLTHIHNTLQAISKKYDNAGIDQLLLAWLLNHPAKIIPVIGTGKPERVQSAARSEQIKLTREDWFRIWIAAEGQEVP